MIGVAASCFLKGPIAMLLTFAVLIVGQGFNEFVEKIVTGQSLGGGPVESIYRMVTHMIRPSPWSSANRSKIRSKGPTRWSRTVCGSSNRRFRT